MEEPVQKHISPPPRSPQLGKLRSGKPQQPHDLSELNPKTHPVLPEHDASLDLKEPSITTSPSNHPTSALAERLDLASDANGVITSTDSIAPLSPSNTSLGHGSTKALPSKSLAPEPPIDTSQEETTSEGKVCDQDMPDAPDIMPTNEKDPVSQKQELNIDLQDKPMPLADRPSDRLDNNTALLEAPATPGAQLRFEEAQSMRDDLPGDGHSINALDQGTLGATDGIAATVEAQRAADRTAELDAPGEAFAFGSMQEAPAQGLRNSAFAGINEGLTLSQRPPIRIDTSLPAPDSTKSAVDAMISPPKVSSNKSTVPSTPQTASPRSGMAATSITVRRERMTTRVSSGALGRKSVSEILGETPRTATFPTEKGERPSSATQKEHAHQGSFKAPTSARLPPYPSPSGFRFPEIKDKDRGKLSTVVFQGNKSAKEQVSSDQTQNEQPKHDPAHDDFLTPLFVAQATAPQLHGHSLQQLAFTSHKTLSTSDSRVVSDESLNTRLLTKIYNLQNTQKWALRQHGRSQEPSRPLSHWDHLVGQMKWMRTDFREERKWKMAAARSMAIACAEWVTSDEQARVALQVRTRPSTTKAGSMPISVPTPDLIPSTEDDPSDFEDMETPPQQQIMGTVAPAAVFTLPPDVFVFGMEKSNASDKILSELPLYEPSIGPPAAADTEETDPDSTWKKPIVPISKYTEGKLLYRTQQPPRKKSRYHYGDDGSGRHGNDETSHLTTSTQASNVDHPVALFDPANKHIRDRIHLGHAFRPPYDYPMPPQSFYEHRSPSQWLQSEDDDLRRYVREYAYNWSFIASCLAPPTRYTSGADRRTPWECFERWVILEGMPAEMAKLNYYRAYCSRIQAAQRNYEIQQQALQQQQQQAGNAPAPIRRRSTQPYLVERRKNSKYLHMIDSMRKLAKKRENNRAKQEQGQYWLKVKAFLIVA